jgi:sporulation protein YlmC with PRC-barrel domain
MRAILATVSLTTLLAVGVAMAQTTPGTPRGPAAPAMNAPAAAPAPAPKAPAPSPLAMEDVSKLKGKNVYGSDDKKIGDISTALMKPDSKTIDRLVVSTGGVVGVGARHVALPIDDFKWDGDKQAFRIAKSADQLKSMPEWKEPGTVTGSSTPPSRSSSPAPAGTGASGTSGAPKQ